MYLLSRPDDSPPGRSSRYSPRVRIRLRRLDLTSVCLVRAPVFRLTARGAVPNAVTAATEEKFTPSAADLAALPEHADDRFGLRLRHVVVLTNRGPY